MRRFSKLSAVLVVSFGLVGCGEDDELSVEQKCDALASAICDRYTQCGNEVSLFRSPAEADRYAASCEPQARAMLKCPSVVEVSPTYGRCIEDLAVADCVINVDQGRFSPAAEQPYSCDEVVTTL
jgi:hypothetical protein